MLEIKFDPSTLTKAQREDLASFILGFEDAKKTKTPGIPDWMPQFDSDNGTIITPADENEITEQEATIEDPNEIFGAPLSAGADPSLTAPEVTTETTSTQPLTAPPPPAPLPATPVGTAAPQSLNPVDVDKNGLPWDARIHSSSRAKVTDGSWKYRRGIDPAEVKRVEDELRQLMSVKVQSPIAPLVAPGTGSNEVDLRKEFAQLMIRASKGRGEGKISMEEIVAVLQPHGVSSLPLLTAKLHVVPQVAAEIDAIIASRG